MRRPLSYLLLVLLSSCLGFQPMALALGTRCMHSAESKQVAAMPDDAHATHRMHDMSGHEGHGQHASGNGNATGGAKSVVTDASAAATAGCLAVLAARPRSAP